MEALKGDKKKRKKGASDDEDDDTAEMNLGKKPLKFRKKGGFKKMGKKMGFRS